MKQSPHRRFEIALSFVVSVLASTVANAQPCPSGPLPVIEAGKLTMSVNATIPPAQYVDKDGKLTGMNIEIGDELARRLCLTPNYQNVQFEVQIPGLQNKRWDVINTGLFYTPERAKIMYLVPYMMNVLSVIVPDGNPKNVKDTKDLAGKIVGVEIAGFEEKTLRGLNDTQVKDGLKSMDIRVFNTYGDTFLALGAGQIDAVFASGAIGAYYQKQGKFTLAITGLFPGSPSAFAANDPKVADAIAAAFNDMSKDGTYQKLMEKYGIEAINSWKDWSGAFKSYHTE